jgi:hypothetical protein
MSREISLLGISYNKISIEKKPDFKGKLQITPSINISSIEKQELSLLKQDSIKVKFSFNIKYSELANILLEGEIILRTDAKTQKEILKTWKDKSLDSEIQSLILNIIMQKASIKAIQLEEEMNLPLHIKIPRLEISKKE